ncbi:MAG: threonine/serine exporter, partial [Tissierellia bacterium]|nr:threonine/serine exporter [Tissierellia bacterium]
MVTAFVSGFISSIGLSILFNIRRKHMVWAAVGGGMATLTYRLLL